MRRGLFAFGLFTFVFTFGLFCAGFCTFGAFAFGLGSVSVLVSDLRGLRGFGVAGGFRPAEDAGVDVGLLKVAVGSGDGDFAAEEEEDVDFEFGAEGGGKPGAVGLEGFDREGNSAGKTGADEDGLKGSGVDPGFALPIEVAGVFGFEAEVEGVAAVHGLAAEEAVVVAILRFGGEGKEAGVQAIPGVLVGEGAVAQLLDEGGVGVLVVAEVNFQVGRLLVCEESISERSIGLLPTLLSGEQVRVVEIPVLVPESTAQGEQMVLIAGRSRCDASVSGFFAEHLAAVAAGDDSMLEVDVAGTLGFSLGLIPGDAAHDFVCRERR